MTTVDANVARAAKILSVRPSAIVEADDAPAGLVITTADGVRYVDVPGDRPDADGKTGLMFLVKPNPDRTYSFPVYTPQPDDEDALAPDADVEADGDPDGDPPSTTVEAPPRRGRGSGEKVWRKFAADHEVNVEGAESRDDVIARCEQAGLIEPEGDNG